MSEEKPKWPTDCMKACMTTRACDTSTISKAIACLCARQYDRDRIRTCIRENCSVPEAASFYDWCAWEIRYLPPELLEISTTAPITTKARVVSTTAPGTTIPPNQDTVTSPESLVALPSTADATESKSRLSSEIILDFTSPISTFVTRTIAPALAGAINGSSRSSTITSNTSVPANSSSQGPALANGAKAGIGFGVAFGVVAFIGTLSVFILRHRKRNGDGAGKTMLSVLPHDQDDSNNNEEKPELPAFCAVVDDGRWRKSELPANENKADTPRTDAAFTESEHHEPRRNGEWHEADWHETHELDPTATSASPTYRTEAPFPHLQTALDPSSGVSPSLAGPIPTASDLYPAPQGAKDDDEEIDLEYQARRLEERRAMIAERERLALEKEQLAQEEEALRRRRASREGTKSAI